MAIEVRIQNFQSIEDATLLIDGLTVITGTNNSGKTAVMRAVGGVFTNPSAASLVRHGAAYLSVSLTFEDGTRVLWEKGWEKPDQKGGTVNRYSLNGKVLENVGRGCPPEVEALGVRPIPAGTDKLWPQVAKQFEGTLFLVNKPGAMLAEALSDVERVGKLTSALRLSEKDKRSVTSELKVRRKDIADLESEVSKWEGLDAVEATVEAVSPLKELAESKASSLKDAQALSVALQAALDDWGRYRDFAYEEPDGQRASKIKTVLSKVAGYRDLLSSATAELEALAGFLPPAFPDYSPIQAQGRKLDALVALADGYRKAHQALEALREVPSVEPPSDAAAEKARTALAEAKALRAKLLSANTDLTAASTDAKHNAKLLAEAEAEVTRLLGDRGFCPTCKTVHTGTEASHA